MAKRCVYTLVVFLVLSVPAWLSAQVDTATLVGTVRDASGAVVPGATVAATQVETNMGTTTKTDAEGNYVLTPLKIGKYSVTAEAAGFKKQTRGNITLNVQDRLPVDFDLQVGAVTETVNVSEAAPLVETETSSLGEVIDSRQITDLPLNGRDYLQLATLTTGVTDTSGGGNNGNIGGAFVANGTRGDLNNFLLDGIDNNSNDNGWAILRTNVDAIQEFKAQTSTYSAEFGRSGGAVINASIKSGTNQFHGGGFEFLRNDALDARGFFEAPNQPKAAFKQNQFGGTLGGPIKKDKTFFFGDYQGTRIRQGLTFTSSVPQAAERSGDFSALLGGQASDCGATSDQPCFDGVGRPIFSGEIYDPSTTRTVSGNTVRDGFGFDPVTGLPIPGQANMIPAGQINAISQAFINLYPDPNQAGKRKNNYIISPVLSDRVDQFDTRIDHSLSAVNQIFGRFSLSQRTRIRPAPLPGLANGGNSSTGFTFENTRGLALGNTHTFSPSVVNEVRVGFNRVRVRRGIPVGGAQFPPSELQVPGVANNPSTNGLTVFAPSGFRRVGDPSFAPTLIVSQDFQLSDSLNVIRGKHSLKIGPQFRRSQFNLFQVANPRGRFAFTGRFTQDPGTGEGGISLADLLVGQPDSSFISTLTDFGNRQHVYCGFVQDDFKATPSLTLNLGLRYDYFGPTFESHDRQSNFDFNAGQLIVANRNGASRGLIDVDKANFAPRLGVAWSPLRSQKTVVRGGYGLFYSGQEIRTGDPLQLAYNVPFFFEPSFISNGIMPLLTVSGGFPPLNVNQAVDPGVTSVDRRFHTPYFQQWNLNIQHEFAGDVLIELGYVGSKGTHLQVLTDRNQVTTPAPAASRPDIQSVRPFPQFGVFTSIENHGISNYHSFQLKAIKHLSHGVTFLSAFTYSKAINDQPEICCSSPWPQNSYNLKAERGLSDFDERLRWVTSFDYQLPLGRGSRYLSASRALDLAFGGWHVGGIVSFGSGFPFSPTLSFDPSNTASQGLVRTDRIANGNLPPGQRTPDNWFDINAFPLPADGTFGNSGKNVLDGPGLNVADLSIRKQFELTERYRLEFRAEFFNSFNHPNFAQPDNFIDDGPGSAGVITDTALAMRQVQFGLKLSF